MDLHFTVGIWVKTFKHDVLLQTWKPSLTPSYTHKRSNGGGSCSSSPGKWRQDSWSSWANQAKDPYRCSPGQWDPLSKEVNGLSSGLCVFFQEKDMTESWHGKGTKAVTCKETQICEASAASKISYLRLPLWKKKYLSEPHKYYVKGIVQYG